MAEEKSKFNMSQLILFRIDRMQNLATSHYRAGRLKDWYFEWKNIKYQIIGKLKDTEREELVNMEKDIEQSDYKKEFGLMEKYMIQIQDYIESKEIGLASKGDETIFS
jgi:hypothetical protein